MKKLLTLILIAYSFNVEGQTTPNNAKFKSTNGTTYTLYTAIGVDTIDKRNSRNDNAYADKVGTATLNSAKADATTKSNSAITTSKAYTDTKISSMQKYVDSLVNVKYNASLKASVLIADSSAKSQISKLPWIGAGTNITTVLKGDTLFINGR